MAIQVRRGTYSDFSPAKMVAGEFADVYSGDPNTEAGTALYICYNTGTVERILTDPDARQSAAIVAESYSVSSTYDAGDLVIKDNQLYKCNTSISTPEAWTAAHWDETTVGEAMKDLMPNITFTDSNNDGHIVISIG